MTLLEAVIIGIIQGATEFLPISSSGHLVLIPAILEISSPDLATAALTHLGTLLAVLAYFRRELVAIARAMYSGLVNRNPLEESDSRLGWYILIATIPAAIAGLLLEDLLARQFENPRAAAWFLLVTAAILVAGELLARGGLALTAIRLPDALVVGFAQVLALFPGISRSGATIAAGIARGMDRAAAARFSFLLGVPAIAGAGLLSLIDLLRNSSGDGNGLSLALAFITAAVVGYLCIHFMLVWLRKRRLYPFAIYCTVVALLFLVFFK